MNSSYAKNRNKITSKKMGWNPSANVVKYWEKSNKMMGIVGQLYRVCLRSSDNYMKWHKNNFNFKVNEKEHMKNKNFSKFEELIFQNILSETKYELNDIRYENVLYFFTSKIIENVDDPVIIKLCVLLRSEANRIDDLNDLKIILAMICFHLKIFIEQEPQKVSLLHVASFMCMGLQETTIKNKISEYTKKYEDINIRKFKKKKIKTENKKAILKNHERMKVHICLSCNIELQRGSCPECKSINYEIKSIAN